jgi:FAD/FMN-containing dehydrogenase
MKEQFLAPLEKKSYPAAVIDAAQVDVLKGNFGGRLVLSGDTDYETARRIWNKSIDKHPAMIARCSGAADIASAISFARTNRLPASVRGGGHNVAGRALCDDGVVIDLSMMRGVIVDPQSRTVRVQGGATLADVDRETHAYGLAVPTGTVSQTGIAGLTLGGGVGWLVRKYGLTCDNLISCEVVTANGNPISSSETINPDLFWGLRGGGGGLGVVSSFLFRLHPVSIVLGGLILYRRNQAGAVLRNYRTFMKTAPQDLTAYCALVTAPDGMPVIGVALCYSGDLSEGERVLQPLRTFGSPILDTIQPMPFPAVQKMLDRSFLNGTYNYWKSTFVKTISDAALDTIVEHDDRAGSPLSSSVVEFYGGAATLAGYPDTAFGQRQAEYNIVMAAQWTDAAESERHIAWAREFWTAMKAYSSGVQLLNLTSDTGEDAARAVFGRNYERLAALKSRYDPTGFFV